MHGSSSRSAPPTIRAIKVIGPEILSLDSFRLSSAIAAMETSAAGPDVGWGNGAGRRMKDWLDVFGFHAYYYDGGAFALKDGGFALINDLKSELARIGFSRPIWQTEFMRTATGLEASMDAAARVMALEEAAWCDPI
jgi:hypothetical protein